MVDVNGTYHAPLISSPCLFSCGGNLRFRGVLENPPLRSQGSSVASTHRGSPYVTDLGPISLNSQYSSYPRSTMDDPIWSNSGGDLDIGRCGVGCLFTLCIIEAGMWWAKEMWPSLRFGGRICVILALFKLSMGDVLATAGPHLGT